MRIKSTIFVLGLVLLSACSASNTDKPTTSMNANLETAAIDRAIEKALQKAEKDGNTQETLLILEQVFNRNPDDPIVATRYARALREDSQINAAIRTLEPFANQPSGDIEAVTEMAMAQLAVGNHQSAEHYARKALTMNEKNARAYLALGTALDASKKHEEAEEAFRNGLKHWRGDASPIMNNLALNLATQGHLQEALTLLEKALKESPRRLELERNRRIISTLLETTSGTSAPKPGKKPEPPETITDTEQVG